MSLIHGLAVTSGLAILAASLSSKSQVVPQQLVHVSSRFQFSLDAPQTVVAPLFGANRERVWAEGWDPHFIHPHPAADQAGAVFSIEHEGHTANWITTVFEPAKGHIQHVYFVPGAMATLIDIHLDQVNSGKTNVSVTYERTALAPEANGRVRKMSEHDAQSGPEWQKAIQDYLEKSRSNPSVHHGKLAP